MLMVSSRPLLSRSGCIFNYEKNRKRTLYLFSSPFIEERLYLRRKNEIYCKKNSQFSSPFIEERLYFMYTISRDMVVVGVLVPFYRGAVVFREL